MSKPCKQFDNPQVAGFLFTTIMEMIVNDFLNGEKEQVQEVNKLSVGIEYLTLWSEWEDPDGMSGGGECEDLDLPLQEHNDVFKQALNLTQQVKDQLKIKPEDFNDISTIVFAPSYITFHYAD